MGAISYWHDSLVDGDSMSPRPALPGDRDADVAIVGAGFTGLWTAYSLLRADPKLRVVVIEREIAGFGASGRNGGWCVGDQAAPLGVLAKTAGTDAATSTVRAMHETVDEVGATAAREGIECGFAKGGAVYFASSRAQVGRLRERVAEYQRFGFGDDDYRMLSARETTAVINACGVHGGSFTPHAAAVHPARLARGLGDAVERLGGVIHEQTAARSIESGRVVTEHGTLRADVVVRATEAYTASLAGHDRDLLPVGNFMISTEPLPDVVWDEIGLARREVFEDCFHLLAYGQRTADGRIAWGGLSAPTWLRADGVPATPTTAPGTARRLRKLLVTRFPVLAGVEITHHWGGVLAIPRDGRPGVGLDRKTGMAWAGGYGGSGVAAANLAGRTLADLITGTPSDLVTLPWVNHVSPPWEPGRPVRWLGSRAVTSLLRGVDFVESRVMHRTG